MIGAMVSQGYSKGYSGVTDRGRQYPLIDYPAVHSMIRMVSPIGVSVSYATVGCRYHSWYFQNGCCIDDL